MKWLKWLSLLVMGMLTITLGTVKAYATCELATTTNESSVTVNATGCDPQSSHTVRIYTGSWNQIDVRAISIKDDGSGSGSITFGGLPGGSYTANIYTGMRTGPDFIFSTPFSIDPSVTPPMLGCGNPCISDPLQKPPLPSNCKFCPATCGPLYDSATGQWSCTAVGGYTPVPTMRPTGSAQGGVMDDIFKAEYLADSQGVLGFLMSKLLPFVYTFAGLCLLVVLISGGLTLMTGAGDQNKVKEGYGKIQAGLIGFLIIFVSYFIVQIVELILGVSIL